MPISSLQAARLVWPADWAAIFGRRAPLLLEIGFGNGAFLLDLARRRLDANLIGLEIALPSLRAAEARLVRASQSNVRLVQADAETALRTLIAAQALAAVYVNFPDPWPKQAHQRRRLIQPPFLALLASRMAAGSRLEIATDHEEYALWIAACLAASPHFQPAEHDEQSPKRLPTKYERKGLAAGRDAYLFRRLRNEAAAADFPIPLEYPMPHALVAVNLTLEEVQRAFQPQQWRSEGTAARLVESYLSARGRTILFDAYVDEERLAQRPMLAITLRAPGQFLVYLHESGFPRPTAGLRLAIGWLAGWLARLRPGGEISYHNLGEQLGKAAGE
ncbi:MAG: tRNA (guanosine(46)-N7)-methyltransferase TrmB [Candidatus Promineifilaceae bacterium]